MTKYFVLLQSYIVTRASAGDRGATMIEYALIVSFIALVALAGVTAFGQRLSTFFTNIANQF